MMFSEQFIQHMHKAGALCVLTGAGISAESGIPTFRGQTGLWNQFRPEELASAKAFINNPQQVWEWYRYRQELVQKAHPNPGHLALVKLENAYPTFTVVTQNVDSLHQLAGSRHVYELHGNIMRGRCVDCNRLFKLAELEEPESAELPRCNCGGMIRPDVVWFGEALDAGIVQASFQAARGCQVFLVVGTSALVQPAAQLPLEALAYGAYVVEINIEPTTISNYVNESIFGKAGTILPALIKQLGL